MSDQILSLALECEQEVLTVRELITALGVRGHAFVVLLFSLPFILPVPLPGLSMIFGLFVAISGLGVSLGFALWLPNWILKRSLPGMALARVFRLGARFLNKLERVLKPRLFAVSDSPPLRVLAGLAIAISGLILALPLPPGTNFPPAGTALLLALGILERDGVFLLAGFLAFVLKIGLIVSLWVFAKPWLMHWF